MKTTALILASLLALLLLGACADESSSDCTCSLYVNDVPQSPNDTAENCTQFGETYQCDSASLTPGSDQRNSCVAVGCKQECTCPDL